MIKKKEAGQFFHCSLYLSYSIYLTVSILLYLSYCIYLKYLSYCIYLTVSILLSLYLTYLFIYLVCLSFKEMCSTSFGKSRSRRKEEESHCTNILSAEIKEIYLSKLHSMCADLIIKLCKAQYHNKPKYCQAVVVAQLEERSLPIPEVCGSEPVIGNLLC